MTITFQAFGRPQPNFEAFLATTQLFSPSLLRIFALRGATYIYMYFCFKICRIVSGYVIFVNNIFLCMFVFYISLKIWYKVNLRKFFLGIDPNILTIHI